MFRSFNRVLFSNTSKCWTQIGQCIILFLLTNLIVYFIYNYSSCFDYIDIIHFVLFFFTCCVINMKLLTSTIDMILFALILFIRCFLIMTLFVCDKSLWIFSFRLLQLHLLNKHKVLRMCLQPALLYLNFIYIYTSYCLMQQIE